MAGPARAVPILPVVLQLPAVPGIEGVKRTAAVVTLEARQLPPVTWPASAPPASKIWPVGNSVPLNTARTGRSVPRSVQAPVLASYDSAENTPVQVVKSTPPPTSTLPFGMSVAAWFPRALFRLPMPDQVPAFGLYSSAGASELSLVEVPVVPPATSTEPEFEPLAKTVAVCPSRRAVLIAPVLLQVAATGS